MRVLTVKEVANLLQLSEHSVCQHLQQGRLPGVKLKATKRGKWRILEDELHAFLRGEADKGSQA